MALLRILVLIHFLFMLTPFHAGAKTYIVKKGDILTSIAYRNFGIPVFSKTGGLQKLLKLNPQIKNADLIFPGQVIKIKETLKRIPASLEELVPIPQIIESKQPEDYNPRSTLKLTLGLDYFRVDAIDKETDDAATILSQSSPTLGLNWNLSWSKEWSTEFAFSFRQDKILEDPNSIKTLNKTTYARTGFSFGLNKHWSKIAVTQFYVGRSERGFLRANSETELRLDSGISTDFGFKHRVNLIQIKTASIEFEFQGIYLGQAVTPGYSTEPGYAAQASLLMRHKLKDFTIEARGSYGIWKQDSEYVIQEAKEVGTLIGLAWEFE